MSCNNDFSDFELLVDLSEDKICCELEYATTPRRISYIINLCFDRILPIDITVQGMLRKTTNSDSYIPVIFRFNEDDRDLMNWAIKMTEKYVPL